MRDPYKTASEVLERNKQNIMNISGVHGIGVGRGSDYGGEDKPCFVVYLDTNADQTVIPKEIENIPVHIEITSPFRALDE